MRSGFASSWCCLLFLRRLFCPVSLGYTCRVYRLFLIQILLLISLLGGLVPLSPGPEEDSESDSDGEESIHRTKAEEVSLSNKVVLWSNIHCTVGL